MFSALFPCLFSTQVNFKVVTFRIKQLLELLVDTVTKHQVSGWVSWAHNIYANIWEDGGIIILFGYFTGGAEASKLG